MKTTSDGISPGQKKGDGVPALLERLQKSGSRGKTVRRPPPASQAAAEPDTGAGGREPIEPAGPGRALGILRLLFFIIVVIWVLAGVYRDPMLAAVGRFLIVSHPLEKADLVVCLGGSPVERGLEAAELVKEEYAPRIFISREEPPEGLDILRARGLDYPENRELTHEMLTGLGLSPETLIISDVPAASTADEAEQMRSLALTEGFSRLIVVTSPQHTRRAWIAFRHIFKDGDVSVMIRPTRFSGFEPEGWWKRRKYTRDVILEYMKIVWYLWAL
jgi:uncharacterized SAM-binding protein YcdF (DUF218 family)